MKKVLNTVLTVFLVIVLVVVTLLSVLMIVTSNSDDGVANIFGYSPITIMDTKSMEPMITSNDLVIVKQQDCSNLQVGDIISFWGFVDGYKVPITHKIVEVVPQMDGTKAYQTQGINLKTNPLRDQDPKNASMQPDIYPEDIIGVYVTQFNGVGGFLSFIKTPTGILVCMVIPIALIFLWQLYRVIMMAVALNREKQTAKNAEMSEEEKQRVIDEYLRAQQLANSAEDPAEEKTVEEKTEDTQQESVELVKEPVEESDSDDSQTTAE